MEVLLHKEAGSQLLSIFSSAVSEVQTSSCSIMIEHHLSCVCVQLGGQWGQGNGLPLKEMSARHHMVLIYVWPELHLSNFIYNQEMDFFYYSRHP